MWCGSSISAMTVNFVCPARAKLGTAITALKVTSIVKIKMINAIIKKYFLCISII
jgi:hypothetical protein